MRARDHTPSSLSAVAVAVAVVTLTAVIALAVQGTWVPWLLLGAGLLLSLGAGVGLIAAGARRSVQGAEPTRDTDGPAGVRALEHLTDGVIVVETDGTLISVNDAAVNLLGDEVTTTPPEQWPELLDFRIDDGANVCPVERFPLVRAMAGEMVRDFECQVRPPGTWDGSDEGMWVSLSAAPVLDETGEPIACVMAVRDRTLSKRVERDLATERQRLERRVQRQQALAGIELAISEPNELQIVLDRIADRARELLPTTAARVVGREDDGEALAVLSRARRGQPACAPETTIHDNGGSTRWIVDHGKTVTVADVEVDPFPQNPSLPDGCRSYAGVPIVDHGNTIGVLYVFHGEERSYGQDDLDFLSALANRASAAIVKVRLYERLRAAQTLLARHHDALEQLVEQRTAELEASHEKLRRTELLASLGTLAAGLEHDMTNVLFPLRCRLDVLDWDALPDEAREALDSVAHSVDYLQQLGRALRELVRRPDDDEPRERVRTALPAWWRKVAPILEQAIPERITLEPAFDAELPELEVPSYRLTQAVLNLVMNSSDAMPDGGRVRVWARNGDHGYVCVGVTDDGPGMGDDVRTRAFEPFFTTKPRDLGTGLGLSLVHSTVQACRGDVSIDSAPGRGTTIVMSLPVATPLDEVEKPSIPKTNHAVVSLRDARDAASVISLLQLDGYTVRLGDDPSDSRIWVTNGSANHLATARAWLDRGADRRIMVLGPGTPDWVRLGAVVVEQTDDLDAICAGLGEVTSVAGALT